MIVIRVRLRLAVSGLVQAKPCYILVRIAAKYGYDVGDVYALTATLPG